MKSKLLTSAETFRGVFALLLTANLAALGQVGPEITTGRPTDWTHHRLVFSDTEPTRHSRSESLTHSARYGSESQIRSTRSALWQMRRDPSLRPTGTRGAGPHQEPTTTIHKDWSEVLSPGLVNPNTFPAKYSFNTTAFSCTSDYVVFPTGSAGVTTTQATILAYNELYGTSGPSGTGCGSGPGGGAVPVVYWAYDTAYPQGSTTNDGGRVRTSPVLSLLGDQVAFIQVGGSGFAALVILKWSSNSSVVALNTATNNVTPANYHACSAPCMTRITLSGSANDTWSAPYYDYDSDAIYVGDDSGKLHKFTGVFLSTPTEVVSGYPVTLGTVGLASPVYDSTSGFVFVGDANGTLYSVVASLGAINARSGTLAAAGAGIYDAPLVDSTTGKVYAFVGNTPPAGVGNCRRQACVYQFDTTFTTGTTGLNQSLGTGGTNSGAQFVFSGAFDNIYYANSGTVGNLYVVGNTGSRNQGMLYRVPFTSGAMRVAVGIQINQVQPPSPSPVTEFCNNGTSDCVSSTTATTSGTDYIFFSAYNSLLSGCGSGGGDGCVLAFNVSTGAPVFSSSLPEFYTNRFNCFVTSGLVVDNAISSTTIAGASQIYFMTLNGTATNLCGNAGGGSLSAVQSAQ
jgi:hypothetical protein